jgi:class 3 adenylate cyclase
MTVSRKLAAILAADVAGYSRLMGTDEEGTLERLKAHLRELIDPKIAEHHGRIVKTTGGAGSTAWLVRSAQSKARIACLSRSRGSATNGRLMAHRTLDAPADARKLWSDGK